MKNIKLEIEPEYKENPFIYTCPTSGLYLFGINKMTVKYDGYYFQQVGQESILKRQYSFCFNDNDIDLGEKITVNNDVSWDDFINALIEDKKQKLKELEKRRKTAKGLKVRDYKKQKAKEERREKREGK